MITLRQVEVYRVVVTAGSVTAAAQMLFVSQPAVSRILGDLEDAVGFKLFARTKRQLVQTEEGKLFYEEIRKAFIGLDDLAQTAVSIREHNKGQLRVITLPSFAATLMPELIAKFSTAYPRLPISIEVQSTERIADWIANSKFDIGLTIPPAESPLVNAKVLTQMESVCILHKNHRLANKAFISAKDLHGERFISFKSDSLARHDIDDLFNKEGCQRNLFVEARTVESICGLVAAGLGVSVVGPLWIPKHIQYNLVAKPFRPRVPVDLLLLTPANRPVSRVAELFIKIVTEHLKPAASPLPARVVAPMLVGRPSAWRPTID
jgi:DNA-binding transcriptional LysR family regulator